LVVAADQARRTGLLAIVTGAGHEIADTINGRMSCSPTLSTRRGTRP
jgi:hypothetical protein